MTPVKVLNGTLDPNLHPGLAAGKVLTKSMHLTLNNLLKKYGTSLEIILCLLKML